MIDPGSSSDEDRFRRLLSVSVEGTRDPWLSALSVILVLVVLVAGFVAVVMP